MLYMPTTISLFSDWSLFSNRHIITNNDAAKAIAGKPGSWPIQTAALEIKQVPWLPFALVCQLAWACAGCGAAACKYIPPPKHVTFSQVQYQMVAPEAPGTSSGSVTATPLEVYLWFIPPGLSHDMTPKLDARRAEGNVCAHSLTIFTANFSRQKNQWWKPIIFYPHWWSF